jgi:carboxypeptidase Taq
MDNKSKYEKLREASREIAYLSSIEKLLSWDQETYLPKDGGPSRATQLAILTSIIHEKKTGNKFKKLLNALIKTSSGKFKDSSLNEEQKAALNCWRKDYLQAVKLPPKFVEEFAKTTSEGFLRWTEARREDSFTLFKPFLEKIIDLSREKAQLLGFKNSPYDALLNLFEPELTVEIIDPIFAELKKGLISLLEKIKKSKEIDDSILKKECSEAVQLKLSKKIMSLMGLNENFCRLDSSAHPFSTYIDHNDIRMTTRFHRNNLISNILSTLHEGGHSLYDHQLPEKHFGSPLGEPISYGMHESQSRFWETLIGKGLPFWSLFFPEVQKLFQENFGKVTLLNFYQALNRVSPSFIRIEADEVTYSLHIIIRYEMEKALISKEIEVADIPSAWNEKTKKYLDLIPPSDNFGCLQDVHWSLGYFGYFPSYTLGNLYASCFFNQFKKDHPDYDKKIKQGDLSFINQWQKENIHQYGRRYSSIELIKKVTNSDFSSQPYLNYLDEKYFEIYGF